jgi:hypothetical protein
MSDVQFEILIVFLCGIVGLLWNISSTASSIAYSQKTHNEKMYSEVADGLFNIREHLRLDQKR